MEEEIDETKYCPSCKKPYGFVACRYTYRGRGKEVNLCGLCAVDNSLMKKG